MDHITYQQILAETYDENAKNLLIHQNDYDSDESEDAYEKHDFEANELSDKEQFNKFHGDRNKPEHVVNPNSKNYNDRSRSDIRTIVLNIDGAFRGSIVPTIGTNLCGGSSSEDQHPGTNSSHFVMSMHRLYRNITSVKMTSMEFMNSFYTFSSARGNTTFSITVGSTIYTITIRDGNYTAYSTMATKITAALTAAGVPGVTFTYDDVTHMFRFTGNGSEIITFPSSNSNPYGNGIGYNLGFIKTSYTIPSISPNTYFESDVAPDLIQDTYVYLQINDWNLLEHQNFGQHSYSVFSKIQLNGAKNTIIFDSNYVNSSTKEYVFQQPVNIQRLEIRMLDAYGNTLDLRNGSFSMTIELHQVNSSSVYEDLIKL